MLKILAKVMEEGHLYAHQKTTQILSFRYHHGSYRFTEDIAVFLALKKYSIFRVTLFYNIKSAIFQVGITSWGVGCGAVDVPGVYASIPSSLCFIDWATKCVHGNKYSTYYDIQVGFQCTVTIGNYNFQH